MWYRTYNGWSSSPTATATSSGIVDWCSNQTTSTITISEPWISATTVRLINTATGHAATGHITWEEWHHGYRDAPLRHEWVPCTPAIIRRLTDRHDREEIAAANAAAIARQAEAARVQAAATDRAMELLKAHLTPAQRKTFDENKWFIVEGGKTKQQYRIHARGSVSANVDVVGEKYRLCAHAEYSSMPYADHLLAQKVMLELDEDAFLRIANRHPVSVRL